MKRKPVIGLSGSRIRMEGGYLTGMEKSLVNSDYLDAVLRVGGLPVIIPPTATAAEIDDYLEMCDGILMTGGMDVAPILYNEMPHPRCGNFDLEVDRSNLLLAQKAMDSGKPVLGICRGMQLMNIAKEEPFTRIFLPRRPESPDIPTDISAQMWSTKYM